jgi:K+-transporting ATPase ATPase C chain
MKDTFVIALRATLVTLVLTGIAYPLAVTAIAQVIFPHRANGSIVTDTKGREVGSELIAQAFANPAYLHPRPSAASYDATSSAGTNLAVTSQKLRDGAKDDPATKDVDESFTGATELAASYRTDNGVAATAELPADAITRSASGLDPEVSPANAELQAARIANARGVTVERVLAVITEYTTGRDLGFLGEERVNVLAVNLALDRTFGRVPSLAADGMMPR